MYYLLMDSSGSVAAILMASGFSERFGKENKLLAPVRGKPMALYTLELVSTIKFSGGIFFVAASEEVAALAVVPSLAQPRAGSEIKVIKNNAPDKGLRESVRLGVEAAGKDAAYYLFFPCDMPFLDADTVQGVLNARQSGFIVEPRFHGKPGNPCLFSAHFRDELLSLEEGETPRIIKERHPEAVIGFDVKTPQILDDIDTPTQLHHISNLSLKSGSFKHDWK